MLKLICFGDSITAGKEDHEEPILTSKLSDQLTGFSVMNAGVSGNTTQDACRRVEREVLSHDPDLVTVLFGANDAAFHKMVDIDEYKSNLLHITQWIGPNKTILITPAPVDESLQKARTNQVLERYANKVNEVVEETGCYSVDLFHEMITMDDYQAKLKGLKNDGLHFGIQGYDILVRLLINKINEIY